MSKQTAFPQLDLKLMANEQPTPKVGRKRARLAALAADLPHWEHDEIGALANFDSTDMLKIIKAHKPTN